MAATSVTQSFDALVSSTFRKVPRKFFEDNILRGHPFLKYMMARDRYMPLDGGVNIVEGVRLAKNSTAKAYSKYEQLDMTPQDNETDAIFEWAQYNDNVLFSGREKLANAGESRIINLLESKIDDAMGAIQEKMAVHLCGSGDGTDGKTLLGLQAAIADDPTTTSCGRIATSETGWRNQAYTTAVAFNTSGAGEARWQQEIVDATFGNRKPSLILCSPTVWNLYATAVRGRGEAQFPVKMGQGDTGFDNDALKFAGLPVIWDSHLEQTSETPNGPGATYTYLIDTGAFKLYYHRQRNFTVDQVRPADSDASAWRIFWMGQLCTNSRRSSAVITNQS